MAKTSINVYIYYLVIFVLSLGATYGFHYHTKGHSDDYMYWEKCALCFISSYFNMFVLYYHYTNAPHPKFVILPQRRLSIYVHIISGVTEFFSCWLAFLTGSPTMGTIAALAAICGHVPSAYYQTSIVFGAKALMVSGYLFAISLHLFCAIHLFLEPASVYWLLNMFLIHNIYVWCRVFYFFFTYVGVFKETIYTNSILTSGLILFPAVIGVSANLFFLGYVGASVLLYFAICRPDEKERNRFVNESTRELLINSKAHETWQKERARLAKLAETDELTDQQKAKQVFDSLDENKNGNLDGEEVAKLLKDWDVAANYVKKFKIQSQKTPITFEMFYRNIWRLGETSMGILQAGKQRDDRSKAEFIFNHLDIDRSGFVDSLELQKLLIQWGLPEEEVDAYLATDEDKQFSFDEFFNNLKPIWAFAYENMLVKDIGQVVQPIQHPHEE